MESIKKIDASGCDIVLATEKEDIGLLLSPNPFDQFVKITYPASFGTFVSAELMDIKGALVWRKNQVTNDEQVDLAFLSAGSYFMKVISLTTGQSQVLKLSKTTH